MAFKMKGSPFQRNFGIGSPVKQDTTKTKKPEPVVIKDTIYANIDEKGDTTYYKKDSLGYYEVDEKGGKLKKKSPAKQNTHIYMDPVEPKYYATREEYLKAMSKKGLKDVKDKKSPAKQTKNQQKVVGEQTGLIKTDKKGQKYVLQDYDTDYGMMEGDTIQLSPDAPIVGEYLAGGDYHGKETKGSKKRKKGPKTYKVNIEK